MAFQKGHKINIGRKCSNETRKKLSIANKGKKNSEETLRKIKLARKNQSPPFKGKNHSIKSKLKISESKKGTPDWNKGVIGWNANEKHHNWKGGISKDIGYKKMMQDIWLQKNMSRKLWHNNNRRVLLLNAIGNFSFQEWEDMKKEYSFTCPCCSKKEPEIKLSIDHIIPLSKGGENTSENIQPLCRSCNSRKNANIIVFNKIMS